MNVAQHVQNVQNQNAGQVSQDALIEARAAELERAAREVEVSDARWARWLRDRAAAVRQAKTGLA